MIERISVSDLFRFYVSILTLIRFNFGVFKRTHEHVLFLIIKNWQNQWNPIEFGTFMMIEVLYCSNGFHTLRMAGAQLNKYNKCIYNS